MKGVVKKTNRGPHKQKSQTGSTGHPQSESIDLTSDVDEVKSPDKVNDKNSN